MAVYVLLTPDCIADYDVQYVVSAAIRHILHLEMQELGNIGQLPIRHPGKRRHAFSRNAFLEERRQVFSVVVAEDQVRRNQARSYGPASRFAVAISTLARKQRRAASR